MKRLLWILSLATTLVLLSACQNQEVDNTIVIWHDKEEVIADVIQNQINTNLPEVQIELIRKESLTDTLKLVGNNESAAPDMYIFAHDKIGLFAEIDILTPITDLIAPSVFDDYLPLTKDAITYKNTIYQLPFYFETLLFMYNKDRLSIEEVPETTEALYQYMKETTNSRRYGFVEQHSNAYYSAGWIHGFGGSILKSDGTPALNDEKTIQALTYHKKFIEYMPSGQAEYATVNALFLEKVANSIISGPWLVPQARDNDINLGFANMPVVDETGLPISPYAGVQGIHVLKVAVQNPEKKAIISNILNVLSSPNIGIEMALSSAVAPAHVQAYLDQEILEDELVMAMKTAAEKAIPMPNLPEMDVMWLTTSEMLVNINLVGNDILDSANSAQRKSEELIDLMRS